MLIDPGVFTYQAHVLDLKKLPKLDAVLITHVHPDHCSVPFLKAIRKTFPTVSIISNQQVVEALADEQIAATTNGLPYIHMEEVLHEKLWDTEPPQDTVFKIFDRLTHPGDSLHFQTASDILALPVQAGWGSTAEAVAKALALQPKYIIPIHDWQWKDEAREAMYKRLTDFFATKDIIFKGVQTGETITLE